jgi:hypothetical protein
VGNEFEKLAKAHVGQAVYVTVSGREYYQGIIMGYGYYHYYPRKKSYEVMVCRKDNHRFVEYFDAVYSKAPVKTECN